MLLNAMAARITTSVVREHMQRASQRAGRRVPWECRMLSTSSPKASLSSMSYIGFAKAYPKTNNVIIATLKTGAADFVAQTVIEGKPVDKVRTRSACFPCVMLVTGEAGL